MKLRSQPLTFLGFITQSYLIILPRADLYVDSAVNLFGVILPVSVKKLFKRSLPV